MFVSAECSSLLDSRIYPCKGMKNYEQLPLRSSHLCRWVKETAPPCFHHFFSGGVYQRRWPSFYECLTRHQAKARSWNMAVGKVVE